MLNLFKIFYTVKHHYNLMPYFFKLFILHPPKSSNIASYQLVFKKTVIQPMAINCITVLINLLSYNFQPGD